MSARAWILVSLLCLALTGTAVWAWLTYLEPVSVAHIRVSEAAAANPMLGASRLLKTRGHQVELASTLGELVLPSVADGTLVIAESSGAFSGNQGEQLLAWVRRGNTLVISPRRIGPRDPAGIVKPGDAGADKDTPQAPAAAAHSDPDTDPVGAHFGVRRSEGMHRLARCDAAAQAIAAPSEEEDKAPSMNTRLACLTLPGAAYPLELDTGRDILLAMAQTARPAWGDAAGDAVRAYAEGKGHVVMLATNFFDNAKLKRFDHAELLLGTAGIAGAASHVTIVQRLDILPWHVALWRHFKPGLAGLALALALVLWMALRRFGPLLPEPAQERRSLIEHIDASGAWLWKVPGGRELLLAALREETLAQVSRRLPALRQIDAADQPGYLARLVPLPADALSAALTGPAARHPQAFTRQVRTLQELRNHYER